MPEVHVTYFTDPGCPWSWGVEPAVRRVQVEFGDQVAITYVMAGLARELDDPVHELRASLDASSATGMPVDPRIWLERPPRSTYPACQAVKAAAEQGLDGSYLRVLREGMMLERDPLDSADALVAAARRVDGMDLERFEIDLRSHAILEAFGADLDRARSVPEEHRSEGAGRVGMPTFVVGDRWIGWRDAVEALPAALREAGASGGELPGVEDALRRFGRMTVPEVAACCGVPAPRAAAELWRLAGDWRARPERVLAADVWRAAA